MTKSSILMGFSLINHLFWGTSIYGKPHIEELTLDDLHHEDRSELRSAAPNSSSQILVIQAAWARG